ncbi:MAG TPA: EscU/YscU/HrcU family type III secretion system export apparatus switch protein [Bryobacteraceae bacterium]|nr:EscU/YscU/HrcU family type III secretion system export apparatus switch protein [Bryobacteraceae bacterium]
MSDRSQRTEQPTPQRIRKARTEGRFASSREFVAAVQFGVSVALLVGFAARWWPAATEGARSLLAAAFTMELDQSVVVLMLRQRLAPAFMPLLAAGGAVFVTVILAQLSLTQFGLATARLTPDLSRLNPASKLRELPGQNLRAAVSAAVMLPLVLGAVYLVISEKFDEFMGLPLLGIHAATVRVGEAIGGLLWRAATLLLVWGAIDMFRQKRKYVRELRMTKQEIREEWKQNEGSPEMKMRLKRMRRDLLRRRMMSEVATATAVVMNPTHFAVALKYDMNAMAAPRVVAKGKNYLALRIKARALEHKVPVIENKPLAQALYKYCAVGQEIPAHLYKAVAEVLAYVFRVMNGKRW